ITPRGVMVHSTGANNPLVARYVQPSDNDPNRAYLLKKIGGNRNANDWNNPGLDVCTHAFVGKFADGSVGTAQTLPWNRRGWHAGTGTSGGSANNTHIAFEICEDALTDAGYFQKVYQEAVELTAMLCKTYNLNPLADGVVICHSEGYQRGIASNHADVMHWFPKFGKSMDTFRTDVAKAMGSA
ncbi:peptidoglycan recognition family protein, partial [Pseudoflavonifractor sp. An85]|uniref:peptidoglycan recognition protein family protein n=1 Tax=Pseudoflavonifractor sp. An85 TaxID=1965661 RepID=UPI00117A01D2